MTGVENVGVFLQPNLFPYKYPNMKMEETECSETSAYKIQTPGNYPEESIQHTDITFLNTPNLLIFKNQMNPSV